MAIRIRAALCHILSKRLCVVYINIYIYDVIFFLNVCMSLAACWHHCNLYNRSDAFARGVPDTIITVHRWIISACRAVIYERSHFKRCFSTDHVQRGVRSLPLRGGKCVYWTKLWKRWSFIYGHLYRLPYRWHFFATILDTGIILLFFCVRIAERGNNVTIPVIRGVSMHLETAW